MNIDLVKIGNFLYEQRNKKGLTQEQLASLVGASFKTISKWECGGSFPDVIYQMPLCNALDITLEELQNGCLDIKTRRHYKFLHIFTISSLIVILVLIPLLIILSIYFLSHVGKPKIYQIIQDDSAEKQVFVQGVLVESYKHNYLIIDSIDIIDYEESINDIVSINLYSENKVLYHINSFDSFIVDYLNVDDINKKGLKLVIDVTSLDGESNTYSINLELKDNIYAVKIPSNRIKYSYSDKDYGLLDRLKRNGFVKQEDDTWTKIINDKSSEIVITYYREKGRIVYSYTSTETSEIYMYYVNFNQLNVNIYINKGSNVLIENILIIMIMKILSVKLDYVLVIKES